MDVPKPGVKRDPRRRWALPDRIFFAHGACHILAGVNLERPPLPGFHAERIVPAGPYPGNHVFVTDGVVAFDYHGYSLRSRLLEHHDRVWASQHAGWSGSRRRLRWHGLCSGPGLGRAGGTADGVTDRLAQP